MDLIPSLALQQVDLPLSIILAVCKLITKGLYNKKHYQEKTPLCVHLPIIQAHHRNIVEQLVTIQNLETFIESDEYPAPTT